MCINLKTLNPKAKEWRPKPQPPRLQLLPHLMFPPLSQPLAAPPPPQQAAQVVLFTPTPPPQYYPQPFPYYHPNHQSNYFTINNVVHYSQNHILYYDTSPAAGECFSTAAKAAEPFCGDESKAICCGKKTEYCNEKKVESLIRDETHKCQGIRKRGNLPPRLRRDFMSVSVVRKPPPKQEWRPRKSANADTKNSGDGDATLSRRPLLLSPPTSLGDDFSRPSPTTVMMKNIPNHLRRDFMLEFLDGCCKTYSLEYDFLYLPMDFRKKDNLGYAFVNLTSAADAKKFKRILHNLNWQMVHCGGRLITSKKICEITWARIQGKEELIKRFQNSNFICNTLEYLPVVLDPPRNGSDDKRAPPVVLGKIR